MNGKILITCREATSYISQKEEHKLSVKGKIQLLYHLMICEVCKLFYKQNKLIVNSLKKLSSDESLSEEEIEKINRTLDDASK